MFAFRYCTSNIYANIIGPAPIFIMQLHVCYSVVNANAAIQIIYTPLFVK